MELFRAHHQWATRPADERFLSVEAMHAACLAYRQHAWEREVPSQDFRAEAVGSDIVLTTPRRQVASPQGGVTLVGGKAATLTHWSFGQVCSLAKCPADYLRRLPPTLAAQNLNYGLASRKDESIISVMGHKNGSTVIRSLNGAAYSRVWNCEITDLLMELLRGQPYWRLPPAYERGADGVFTGQIAPSGAYASDHDMFVFLVDEHRRIQCAGSEDGLYRGFFIWNSEVGAKKLGFCAFLYDMVCGNHIVWGAKELASVEFRHVGEGLRNRVFGTLSQEFAKLATSSPLAMEGCIKSAQGWILGSTKEEVVDHMVGVAIAKKLPQLTQALVVRGYEAAEKAERYGSPRSLWGMVNGLTEVSQETGYVDVRSAIDRAAGKLLDMVG